MLAVRLDLCDPGVWRCQFHANIELNWWICSNTCLSLSIDTSPSPPGSYRGCTVHCDSCGKCVFLCQEHSGCTCYDEEDLPPHCTVCCCLRDALYCPFACLQWLVIWCPHLVSFVENSMNCIKSLSLNLPNKKLIKKRLYYKGGIKKN